MFPAAVGCPWDFKMSVSGPPWLCMEDEFWRVGRKGGTLGRAKKSMVEPGLRWGWELENQGRFQDHSGGEMDLEWFSSTLRPPSSHLVMGGWTGGPRRPLPWACSGSTVRLLVLSHPVMRGPRLTASGPGTGGAEGGKPRAALCVTLAVQEGAHQSP